MAMIHRKIDIQAKVEKVYGYIENPCNLTSWMQGFKTIRNVRGIGEGTRYKLLWDMAGVCIRGEFRNIEDVSNEQIVLKSKGGIESLWSFRFENHKEVTTLDLDIDYRIPDTVKRKMPMEILLKRNEKDMDVALRKLKEQLESKS